MESKFPHTKMNKIKIRNPVLKIIKKKIIKNEIPKRKLNKCGRKKGSHNKKTLERLEMEF